MGKGGGSEPKESEYEETLARMANELYGQTSGMRGNLINELTKITTGKYKPWKSPMWNPIYSQAKTGIEDQYGVARENIISTMPRGGVQLGQLGNLEMGRAEQASALPAMISKDIISDMMSKAYGAAFGAPQQSMAGLGTAAGTYGGRQAAAMSQQAQEDAAKWGGLGMLGGSLLGAGGGSIFK